MKREKMYKYFGASKKLLLTKLQFQIHQPESRIIICITWHGSASQKLTNFADFHPNENLKYIIIDFTYFCSSSLRMALAFSLSLIMSSRY